MEESSPPEPKTLAPQCELTEPAVSPAKTECLDTNRNTDASQPGDASGETGRHESLDEEGLHESLDGEGDVVKAEDGASMDEEAVEDVLGEALVDSTEAEEVLNEEEAQSDHAARQEDKEEEGTEVGPMVQAESDSFVETGPDMTEPVIVNSEMFKEEDREELEDEEKEEEYIDKMDHDDLNEEEEEYIEKINGDELKQEVEEEIEGDELNEKVEEEDETRDETDSLKDESNEMDEDTTRTETPITDISVSVSQSESQSQSQEGNPTNSMHEHEEENEEEEEPPPLPEKRRKRGRPAKARKDEEDLCFICFDGGELVVCDRRGCPKVYHPSCVNRDESFFRSKGKWNCGWHICSTCEKPARNMCYTCTYSLCRGCIKDSDFLCVRGNLGFCPTCLPIVIQIEKYEQGDATSPMEGVNFEDKNSWEYLFRDYWLDLKSKQTLTLDEISAAQSKQRTIPLTTTEKDSSDDSDTSSAQKKPKKRPKRSAAPKPKPPPHKKSKKPSKDKNTPTITIKRTNKRIGPHSNWASRELLDFVAHMRQGDKSQISQFDVQALLLEYIKKENLRDPRRKSQIVCDRMLVSLFNKERVGHFEMLKLLESHFVEASGTEEKDETQGGVVDPDPDPFDPSDPSDPVETSDAPVMEKRRKGKGKGNNRAVQGNLDDFAAIDAHNIGLMYLRRNLMEEIVYGDPAVFDEKVLGAFVRIRISGNVTQRQDIYRLVQVVGTGKAAEKYKMGKKMTDITLEILNLDKQEYITIDIISNQDFTEEECKRLRQSIKCGFIPRLTVGEVQEKARVLQAIRVNDWIESEKLRLAHLRDRASETGRRKELRECVEKLQVLNTPEEKMKRLREMPEIHADPTMDPDYESAEEPEPETEKKDVFKRRDSFGRDSSYERKDSFERRGDSSYERKDSFDRRGDSSYERKDSFDRRGDSSYERKDSFDRRGDSSYERKDSFDRRGDSSYERKDSFDRRDSFSRRGNDVISPRVAATSDSWRASLPSPTTPNSNSNKPSPHPWSSEKQTQSQSQSQTGQSQSGIDESEKMWKYLDPAGKAQGPFSMAQLRKWNGSGYFPADLKIWRMSEKQEDAFPLTDALTGKFPKKGEKVPEGSQGGFGEMKVDLVSQGGGGSGTGTSFPVAVVNTGTSFPASVSQGFASGTSFPASVSQGFASSEGLTQLLGTITNQISSTQQQQAAAPIATSDPTNQSNPATSASSLPTQPATQALNTANAAWAAAMAQQMTTTGPMGYLAQTNPAAQQNPWMNVNVAGPAAGMTMNMAGPTTGMNMNMAVPTTGVNMNMNMNNMGWAPQFGMANPWAAAQMQAWGGMMPGAVNPGNQFPGYWAGPQAQSGNPIPNVNPVQTQGSSVVVSSDPNNNNNNNNDNNNNNNLWGQQQQQQRGGICRFYESGHCKKGSGCNYYHPPDENNNINNNNNSASSNNNNKWQ